MGIFGFFIIIWIIVINAFRKEKKKNDEINERLEKSQSIPKAVSTPATAKTGSTSQANAVTLKDPVCEEYDNARRELLRLYKAGAITEENLMAGNCELYDQYMKEPMDIANTLRQIGIRDQAKIEPDGDFAIFFPNEQAAWQAANAMHKAVNAKLIASERRNTGSWAYLPFELGKYTATIMIDRSTNLYKMVVIDKSKVDKREQIHTKELEEISINAFDFTK